MTKSVRQLTIVAAMLLSSACNSQTPQKPEQDAVAADACALLLLSKAGLQEATTEAKRGSIEAQRKLWSHYQCADERKADYWQDRLIASNDADALLVRSSTLHLEASRLADSDPRKLVLLRKAQEFEERGRKVRGDGVDNVLINGKEVAVPYSSAPDEYTERLAREIDRLSSGRLK